MDIFALKRPFPVILRECRCLFLMGGQMHIFSVTNVADIVSAIFSWCKMLKIARWAVFFKPDQWRRHPKDESAASKCESAHQLERSLQWQMTALLLTFPPGWKLYSVIAGKVTHTEYKTTKFRTFRPCSTVDSRDRDKDTKTKQRTSLKSRFVNENQSHVLLEWNFAGLRFSCLETKTEK